MSAGGPARTVGFAAAQGEGRKCIECGGAAGALVVGERVPPAVEQALPLLWHRGCSPTGPEQGARDGGDRVGVVADPDRSGQGMLQVQTGHFVGHGGVLDR